MAESVKKPATKKPAKKTTKKPATKKPVTSSKAKTSTSSTLTKKPATKKPTKKTTKKPAPKKPKTVLSSAKDSSHFTKELIPESLPMMKKNKTKVDTSMFTTVLAIFIVALVVLGGYIYSRQQRMMEPPAPPVVPEASNPQNIRISSSISLTPEIVTALENIVTQIAIGPEEVLEAVRMVDDVESMRSESPDFFTNARQGDYVFQFKSAALLYRPSTTEIVKTGLLPPVKN